MAEFRVSRAASRDIESIGRYTQMNWGADKRRTYLADMEVQFSRLAENPYLASERAEFNPPVRMLPYQRHIIVYLVTDAGVLIVRVLHERMDVRKHLQNSRDA